MLDLLVPPKDMLNQGKLTVVSSASITLNDIHDIGHCIRESNVVVEGMASSSWTRSPYQR
uniref:Uncharacterized protein n=1 Tax=Phlebotomus papatasi TaxID=29031 RepID=A0A1B0DF70_PHLPP